MAIEVKKKINSLGERLYDASTSWLAILFFFGLCSIWAGFNSIALFQEWHFDPYPFHNLRLLLSFIGAIQAPLLLTYSRKSTDSRKKLLEKDFKIAKKTLKKVKWIKKKISEREHNG